MSRVFLDHAATSPLREAAFEAMRPWLLRAGANASQSYASAREARRALEDARASVAEELRAEAGTHVFFTSGGTESNNWALRALASAGPHAALAVGAAEHASVLNTARVLQSSQASVVCLPVDGFGRVTTDTVRTALKEGATAFSCMWANNETGVLNPIYDLVGAAREEGALFHSDAVAACGHTPVYCGEDGPDLLSVSAHKFGGPQGIGALVVHDNVRLAPMLAGGAQEKGMRAGTEPVALAVGMAAALREANAALSEETRRLGQLRSQLETTLTRSVPGIRVTARDADRLAGTVHLLLPGMRSEAALIFLDRRGIECSAGSACHAGAGRPSGALLAMGIPEEEAGCALRISMGHTTRQTDILEVCAAIRALCTR